MKHLIATLALGGCALFATPVYDTAVGASHFTGSRESADGEVIIAGTRYKTFNIAWNITQVTGGFNYSYTFTYTRFTGGGTRPAPAISHFILDLSTNCTEEASGCVQNQTYTGAPDDYSDYQYGTFGAGPSNPGLPAGKTIQGIKFNTSEFESGESLTFFSTRIPVWGDFYIKGGSAEGAYNKGLTHPTSANILDFIARPDTVPAPPVPEPGTWVLLGIAGAMLGVAKLRRS